MRGREFTMKDAYFRPRRSRRPAQLRHDVRRLHAHLQPPGPEFRAVAADTGSIGGTRSHEFRSSPKPARTCWSTTATPNTPPTSSWPRRPTCTRCAARPASPWPKWPPRRRQVRGRGQAARHPAGTDRQIHRPGHRRRQGPGPDLASDAARRPRAERDQGRQAARPASASPPKARSSSISAASPAIWARSAPPAASWPTARSPTWRISSAAPTRNTSTSRA